jgi:hypothetical protein
MIRLAMRRDLSDAQVVSLCDHKENGYDHRANPGEMISRVACLGRAHCRGRLVGTGAVALLGLVVLLGATVRQEATPIEEVRTMCVILMYAQGDPRGRVGVESDGTPRVFLTEAHTPASAINTDGELHARVSPDGRGAVPCVS